MFLKVHILQDDSNVAVCQGVTYAYKKLSETYRLETTVLRAVAGNSGSALRFSVFDGCACLTTTRSSMIIDVLLNFKHSSFVINTSFNKQFSYILLWNLFIYFATNPTKLSESSDNFMS